MINKFYKTSEFATLCGIKKHTLYHYDEIGLLQPSVMSESGYRYYTIDQFEKFNIISVLKKAGTPLDEIKLYLNDLDTHTFLSVLHTKLNILQEEAKKIEKMCTMLSSTISAMENHLHAPTENIEIIDCEEEYLIATKLPDLDYIDEQTMLKTIGNHLQYCLHHNFNFHVGEIILEENIKRGIFKESYYYSPISKKIDDNRLFIKPRGTYAVMYHGGSYDTLYKTYKEMKAQIESQGYTIMGNIYEEDMIDYLSEHNSDNYILKISMQIS